MTQLTRTRAESGYVHSRVLHMSRIALVVLVAVVGCSSASPSDDGAQPMGVYSEQDAIANDARARIFGDLEAEVTAAHEATPDVAGPVPNECDYVHAWMLWLDANTGALHFQEPGFSGPTVAHAVGGTAIYPMCMLDIGSDERQCIIAANTSRAAECCLRGTPAEPLYADAAMAAECDAGGAL